MFRTAIDIAGGVAAVVIAVCLGLVLAGFPAPTKQSSLSQASVNREAKSDRLPVAAAAAQPSNRISVIEVIGVSDAAVVYRDRGGQVLFKTDPLSNATVVAKNTTLPEITVRDTQVNEVMPVPVEMPDGKPAAVRELPDTGAAPEAKGRMPEGCESAFSSFLVPSQSKIARRCVSSLETNKVLAAN